MPTDLMEARMLCETGSLRVAVFTHDTYGIGHVRRSLHILREVAHRRPDAAILFVTGSPAVELFKHLPPNADHVKVPTIVPPNSKREASSHLPIPQAELSLLRRRLVEQAVLGFA